MRIETTFGEEFETLYNEYATSVHGKKMIEVEGIERRSLDIGLMSHLYFTENLTELTIDANANMDSEKSPNNYCSEVVKGLQKLEGYYLLHRYAVRRFGLDRANKLVRGVWNGDYYFHDASGVGIQQPYCYAASTSMLMIEGRKYGQLYSVPPKRARSFISQCIEFVMDCSQGFAGAVALSDMIINYAYFAKKENLSDKEIENDLQSFVHVVNNSFRVGGQSPFTNISIFDMANLKSVFKLHRYPDGSSPDFGYIMHLQTIFIRWFAQGDPSTGLPYRFPICTVNIACDEHKQIIDKDFLGLVAKLNILNGCFNIYVNSGSKIASCCRLVNDAERMRDFRVDTFGNGGSGIGSHRVVTINMPRVALKAKGNADAFYLELETILSRVRDLLQIHREDILTRRVECGFLRFFNPLRWFSLNHLFSTIGIVGIPEMAFFMGHDIRTNEGQSFVVDVLTFVEEFAKNASIELGYAFNVEEIPAESTSIKFVVKDKIEFGDEHIPFELYSNQYISLTDDVSLAERIEISGKLMDLLSGGGILHLNIKERITDPDVMAKLIVYAVGRGVSHLAINYGFGICRDGHTTVCGNSTTCHVCGNDIADHYTRVVGYFVPVSSWNKVRREYEFPLRKFGHITSPAKALIKQTPVKEKLIETYL